MSQSTGSIVGGILGAVVGYFIPVIGIPLGYALGAAIGGYVAAPDGPNVTGPRLQDLKITTSSYGAYVADAYGTVPVAGNIFWFANNKLKETSHKQSLGGKGGPSGSRTTYTYSATFAVGLCKGPIVGIRKIWCDSVLVFDGSSGATTDARLTGPEVVYVEDVGAGGVGAWWYDGTALAVGGLNGGSEFGRITVYSGTETQNPDPTIESFKGTGQVPGYRGLAYIVWEDLQLQRFGNRIPNVRVEVVTAGGWTPIGTLVNKSTPAKVTDNKHFDLPRFDNGTVAADYYGLSYRFSLSGTYLGASATLPFVSGSYRIGYLGNWLVEFSGFTDGVLLVDGLPIAWRDYEHESRSDTGYFSGAAVTPSGRRLYVLLKFPDGTYRFRIYDSKLNIISEQAQTRITPTTGTGYKPYVPGLNEYCFAVEDDDAHLWYVYPDIYNTLICYRFDSAGELQSVLGRTDFGDGPSGLGTLIADQGYCAWIGQHLGTIKLWIASREATLSTNPVNLSDVMQSIIAGAGIAAGDVDVAGVNQQMSGYAIARLSDARSNLLPLQTAYDVDVIDAEYTVRCVPRGAAPVATIPANDLAAHEAGQQRPAPIDAGHPLESDLPQRLNVVYMDPANDYQQGTQSAGRIVTNSSNVQSVQMPVVLSADEAAQLADKLLRQASVSEPRSFELSYKYARLLPGDPVSIPGSTGTELVRISQIDDDASLLKIQAAVDSAALHQSSAVGISGGAGSQIVSPAGPTELILLDIPDPLSQDVGPELFTATAGYLSGWRGCVIQRSADNGQSWSDVAAGFVSAGVGVTNGVLADGPTTIWDEGNTLNLMLSSGSLASATEAAVLNGANALAIGSDGAWEIVQFTTATLESDGSYTISGLLRGRRGTEWATSGHAAGDQVVVLQQDGSIRRVALSADEIGTVRDYRAVSIGNDIAEEASLTFEAVCLKPFSPVHVNGTRASSGDWSISWIRRTRVDGAWRSGSDVSLGEQSEAYEIDVLDGSGNVVRTISNLTSQSATYTNAQQTSDFGAGQASITIRIYQLSAIVGRGYPTEATL